MKRFALGIDPGRHAVMALLEDVPVGMPRLVGLWTVTSGDLDRWFVEAKEGMRGAAKALEGQAEGSCCVWMENPTPVSRQGSLAGDSRGQKTWGGIGKYRGLLLAALHEAGFKAQEVTNVEPGSKAGQWWSAFGRFMGKKIESGPEGILGWHRVEESARFIHTSKEALEKVPKSYRVDAAEAVLIGAAALLLEGGKSETHRITEAARTPACGKNAMKTALIRVPGEEK